MIQVEYSNLEEGQYALKENKVWGFLHFTKNFSINLASRFNDKTDISDSSNPDTDLVFESIDAWIDGTSKITSVAYYYILIIATVRVLIDI